MKLKGLLLSLTVAAVILTGCGSKGTQNNDAKKEGEKNPDVVSGASIAKDEQSLEKALSKDGTWIIVLKSDLTSSKELVMEGEFTKADKNDASKKVPAGRKLALYDQDDKRNKTASYTLKAPKLTIKSENAKIQGGTFVGDVYVEAKDFSIVDGKVEGNVYFANEEAQKTFKTDKGTVTGKTEIKK